MPEVKDNKDILTEEARSFLSQKLEKIAHAIYLITSAFPHDEPLRGTLRNLSLGLLRMRQSLSGNVSHNTESVYNLSDILSELQSLISLSRTSRLISEANASILLSEISSLLDVGKDVYGEPLLSAGDLSVPVNKQSLAAVAGGDINEEKTETKPSESISAPTSQNTSPARPAGVSRAKTKRRDAILEALRDMGEVGIKEISKEVRGCSRKTIQRELSTLTDKGFVSKSGERRWSTYKLTPEGRAVVGS